MKEQGSLRDSRSKRDWAQGAQALPRCMEQDAREVTSQLAPWALCPGLGAGMMEQKQVHAGARRQAAGWAWDSGATSRATLPAVGRSLGGSTWALERMACGWVRRP